MNNSTKKTMLTLLALAAFGVSSYAETPVDGTVTIETNSYSTLEKEENGQYTVYSYGTGDYTGTGTIKLETAASFSHNVSVKLGTDFSGTLDYTGDFRSNNGKRENGGGYAFQNYSENVTIELSSRSGQSDTMYGSAGVAATNNITFKTNYGLDSSYSFAKDTKIINGSTLTIKSGASSFTNLTIEDGSSIAVNNNVTLNSSTIFVVLSDASAYSSKALISGEGTVSGTMSVTIDAETAVLNSLISTQGSLNLFGNSLTTTGASVTVDLSQELKDAGYSITSSTGGVLTIVPEPSAFGLLAGLGALALVASRRRRRG